MVLFKVCRLGVGGPTLHVSPPIGRHLRLSLCCYWYLDHRVPVATRVLYYYFRLSFFRGVGGRIIDVNKLRLVFFSGATGVFVRVRDRFVNVFFGPSFSNIQKGIQDAL